MTILTPTADIECHSNTTTKIDTKSGNEPTIVVALPYDDRAAQADTACQLKVDHEKLTFFSFLGGYRSYKSRNAIYCLVACNGLCAIVACNAILSVVAVNSFMSLFSINSILSIGSMNSILAVGCYGEIMKICL